MWSKNRCIWTIALVGSIALMLLSISSTMALNYWIEAPEQVDVGEWFQTNLTVNSENSLNLTTYAYIFKNLDNIGQGWTANKQTIAVNEENQTLILKDLVKFNTEPGLYKLRIKMNFDNQSINETFNVQVIGTSDFKESYLYVGLILVSIFGIGLIVWRWSR